MLQQIASLAPKAGQAVSRFVSNVALALVPRLASRFMAVARPKQKDKGGGAASASGNEIISSFLSSSGNASDGAADLTDFGSTFLAPPMAPRPTPSPKTVRRRLRSRFRARHFLKPPWMR
ncbi:hypothetical protein [Sandaracinobacteroides sayramensis]|uniref:hypothetical protein n=1 Tax=Sandaracinobacteroides sayramensis TaxID=2913411 RepID=UPI001EDB0B6E|nr:hypothetical protein [Sandaracinobacteroides sayramensis]